MTVFQIQEFETVESSMPPQIDGLLHFPFPKRNAVSLVVNTQGALTQPLMKPHQGQIETATTSRGVVHVAGD